MGTSGAFMRLKYVTLSVRKCLLQRVTSQSQVETLGCSRCRHHALSRQGVLFSASPASSLLQTSSRQYQDQGCRAADETSLLNLEKLSNNFEISDTETAKVVSKDFELHENFVSEEEGSVLFEEVEDYLEDLEYQYDHWDNAIHGYRETEKSRWSEKSQDILQRVRLKAFPSREQQLSLVHVLDLAKDGYIKPHVDSVKFCGTTITGLSLLSPAIMRLVKQDDPRHWVNVVLKPGSLYVMRDRVRFEFTHEILKESESLFRGQRLPRDRRISIMCRNEPA